MGRVEGHARRYFSRMGTVADCTVAGQREVRSDDEQGKKHTQLRQPSTPYL